jgi:anti-sigma factor RsiW
MCPDRQILSVYFDGELPSPWKEKMEAHLASCSECRGRLEKYRLLTKTLSCREGAQEDSKKPLVEASIEAAKDRIWRNLSGLEMEKWGERRKETLWRRSVPVPLPAAAAAAIFIILACIAVLARQPLKGGIQDMAATGMNLDAQEILPVADMNGILQYLGNNDTADFVIIRLPESKNFMSAGEPTILKAADYSRRNLSQ